MHFEPRKRIFNYRTLFMEISKERPMMAGLDFT
jgi:hypothetical protein